jgi:hypothetical protein
MGFGDKNFTYGPRIVKDGLVFYMDAANPNCYISGNTTCNDLISNVSGFLENGTLFSTSDNGVWIFDGVDDYIEISATTIVRPTESELNTNGFTIMAWINVDSSISQGVFSNDGINQATYYGLETSINSSGYFSMHKNDGGGAGSGNTSSVLSDATVTAGVWTHVTYNFVSADKADWEIYVNGLITTPTLSGSGGSIGYSPSLSGGIGIRQSFTINGNISNVKIYNRTLSSNEITQNYNALKGRFGL